MERTTSLTEDELEVLNQFTPSHKQYFSQDETYYRNYPIKAKKELITECQYFCPTNEVWTIENVPKNEGSYGKLYSDHWKNFGRDEKYSGAFPYEEVRRKVTDDTGQYILLEKKDSTDSRSGSGSVSSATSNNCALDRYKWDIFGGRAITMQNAHLLPVGGISTWIGVAGAVLGVKKKPNECDEHFILKLVKATVGVAKNPEYTDQNEGETEPLIKKMKIKSNEDGSAKGQSSKGEGGTNTEYTDQNEGETKTKMKSKSSKRENHTGVVHFPQNLIRLCNSHFNTFDGKAPGYLIVPCMTLDDAKKWKGTGYAAVVLPGLPYGLEPAAPSAYNELSSDVATILRELNVSRADPCIMNLRDINDTELEKARTSLEGTLYALIDYVESMAEMDMGMLQEPYGEGFQTLWAQLEQNTLRIPKTKTLQGRRPLLHVTFGPSIQKDDYDNRRESFPEQAPVRAPAPDPLLLLVKAAVNWGCMTDFQLIANGEDDDSLCTSDDEVLPLAHFDACPSCWDKVPTEISFTVTPK